MLAAITAGVIGLLAWGLLQDPSGPWQSLPDGSRVRVVGSTYGTQHRMDEGRVWQRLLLPISPPAPVAVLPPGGSFVVPMSVPIGRLPGVLGGLRYQYDTANPVLVVWLQHQVLNNAYGQPHFTAEDEHGCSFPAAGIWNPDLPGSPTTGILIFDAFPRREGLLRLVTQDWSRDTGVGPTLTVRFPNSGSPPTWQPGPLPQTKQSGPLTISHTGWTPMRSNPTAEFEVRQNGQLTRAWEPVTVKVTDATGNSVTTVREHQNETDPRRFGFRNLCFREKAWKLHTEFVPVPAPRPVAGRSDPNWSPAPRVKPSWRWNVRIPAPGSGDRFSSGLRHVRPELQLEILRASAAGVVPAAAWGRTRLHTSAVRVRLHGAKEPVRLTLNRVTDEKGRTASPGWPVHPHERLWDPDLPRPSQLFRSGTQERSFVLPDLPGARTLRLEFEAHRAVPADFLVAPP